MGYSPKHVLLLHEMDITVLFIDALVAELRNKGWTIIPIDEAFEDPLYLIEPKNTFANNGVLDQIAFEKTKIKPSYSWYKELNQQLDTMLGL